MYHTRHEGEVRDVGLLFPRICTAMVGHYAGVMEHSGAWSGPKGAFIGNKLVISGSR